MMWWDGRALEEASSSPRVVRSQKNEFFFRRVVFDICSGVADGLQQGSNSARCTPGGEALTVPVLPFPGEGTRCHCQGRRDCPVRGQSRDVCPFMCPQPCGWAQSPAVSGRDSSRSSREAPRCSFQGCANKVLPSLPLPRHKGAAPAAFPQNRATLGLPLVLLL